MPDVATDRRRLLLGVVVLLVVLVLAGRVLLRPGRVAVPPPVQPTATSAEKPPAARDVYVDVAGAVRRPGLYRLREGSRVADALARAGGVTAKAQLELVNRAALVADGEQIVVPRRGVAVGAPGGGGGSVGAGVAAGPVHLNSATLDQLDALSGVGPVTAQKIIDYREQHGGFRSVDELDAVPGIGPARLEQLREGVAP